MSFIRLLAIIFIITLVNNITPDKSGVFFIMEGGYKYEDF